MTKPPTSQLELEKLLMNVSHGRRRPDDPLFAEGDLQCMGPWEIQGVYDIDEEEFCHKPMKPFSCEVPGCTHVSLSLIESEQHYSSLHRHECGQCHKHLASPRLLDLHLCEAHDSFFELQANHKPMFACFVDGCNITFWNAKERLDHCVIEHKYPSNFRFDEGKKNVKKKNKKQKKKKNIEQCQDKVEIQDPETMTLAPTQEVETIKEYPYVQTLGHENKRRPFSSAISGKPQQQNSSVLLGSGCSRGKKGGVLSWYQVQKPVTTPKFSNDISMNSLSSALPEQS